MRLCTQKVGSPCETFSQVSGNARLRARRRSSALVNLHSSPELLVLVADELDHVRVHLNLLIHPHSERLRVRLRVVDGDVDFETAETRSTVALGDHRLISQRTPSHIQPAIVAEVVGLRQQYVAFPAPDGVAIPPRLRTALG